MQTVGKSGGGKFSGAFGKVAKVGAVSVGALFAGALTKGFGRLTAIENAQASLRGLGYSGKEVAVIMTSAEKSVLDTAFGLDSAAKTAAGAIGAGVKPGKELTKYLTLTADAAGQAGIGMDEMGRMMNKVAGSGRLTGDVLNQMSENGLEVVPILSEAFGKTGAEIREMASKGQISAAQFQDALRNKIGGSAVKAGQTTTGALANMNTAFARLGAKVLSGFFPQLKNGFMGMTASMKALQPAAIVFGAAIGTALSIAVTALGGFLSAIGSAAGFVAAHSTTFKILAAVLTVAVIPAFVLWGVQATIAAAKNVAAWISSTAVAVASAPLHLVGLTLIAAGWIKVGIQSMLGAVKMAAAWLIALGPIGLVIVAVAGVVFLIVKYWDTIKAKTVGVWSAITGAVSRAVSAVVGFVKAHWPLLLAIITGPIGLAVLLVVKHWARIKSATSSAFNFVRSAVSSAVNAARSSVSSAVGGIVSIFRGLLGKIKGALSGAGSALKGIGKNIVNGLISGIRSMGGAIGRALVALLPGPLKKFAGKLGIASPSKVFAGFGMNIGQGLALGVDRSRSSVEASMSRLVSSVTVPNAARFDVSAASGAFDRAGSRTIIYNAADGPSLSAEELLFKALSRSRAVLV